MMTPLRIEFVLAGHLDVPAMPIHLDSLVAYARYQRALEEQDNGAIRDLILDLPLQKESRNNSWVWQASALAFDNKDSAGMRHWTRKTVTPDYYAMAVADGSIERGRKLTGDVETAKKKNMAAITQKDGTPKFFAQKIDTVRGEMKAELQSYAVCTASKAVAYCVGDADELSMLLDPENGLLTHIGKRSRLGQGRILKVLITPDEDAMTLWKHRILPWKEEGYLGLEANVIPPYWDAAQKVSAWGHPSVF